MIATDDAGLVNLMNPIAESLTGWSTEAAHGKHLNEVFRIVNEQTRQSVESPVAKVLRVGAVVGLANHTLLIRRDGTETAIEDSAAPIVDRADDERILPPVEALPFLQLVEVDADEATAIRAGRSRRAEPVRVVHDGELVAVDGTVLPA